MRSRFPLFAEGEDLGGRKVKALVGHNNITARLNYQEPTEIIDRTAARAALARHEAGVSGERRARASMAGASRCIVEFLSLPLSLLERGDTRVQCGCQETDRTGLACLTSAPMGQFEGLV